MTAPPHYSNQKILQLSLLYKKLLTNQHLPSHLTSISKPSPALLKDISLSQHAEIIGNVLQQTRGKPFRETNMVFWRMILNQPSLSQIATMGAHNGNSDTNSSGQQWREALLDRPMDKKLRRRLLDSFGHGQTSSTQPKVKSQSQTENSKKTKRPLGFNEIRFHQESSMPEAFHSKDWHYLTKREQKQTMRKIKNNHKRLEEKERKIVELLSKQSFCSPEEYQRLDSVAAKLDPRQASSEEESFPSQPSTLSSYLLQHIDDPMIENTSEEELNDSIQAQDTLDDDYDGDSIQDSEGTTSSTRHNQDTEERIVRLFYSWIEHHIAIKPENVDEEESPEDVLEDFTSSSSKAVAQLFQQLCQSASVECFCVQGCFRDPEISPRKNLNSQAWWNICKVGVNYRLVDCFSRGFFMDPRQFVQSHLPDQLKWALMSPELLPSSVEEWYATVPNYTYSALDSGLSISHPESGEASIVELSDSNRTSLLFASATPISSEELRLRVMDGEEEVPFSWCMESLPSQDGIVSSYQLHFILPHSGDFDVQFWIPMTDRVSKYQQILKTIEEYEQAEEKRLLEEAAEKQRQLQEAEEAASKGKKKSKTGASKGKDAKPSSDEAEDTEPSKPRDPLSDTHCLACVRNITVSESVEISESEGYPMPVLHQDFKLLSHTNPVVHLTNENTVKGVTIRFLSKTGSRDSLGKLTPRLLPQESQDEEKPGTSKGKKPAGKAKKGKGVDLEDEDLTKFITQQNCPLAVALDGAKELPEDFTCFEFTFSLPSGCEGRTFEITCEDPRFTYQISVDADCTVDSCAASIEESAKDDNLYIPMPFDWKFQYVTSGDAELKRAYLEGKKPIECTLEDTPEGEKLVQNWMIPTQKKGSFRVMGELADKDNAEALFTFSL